MEVASLALFAGALFVAAGSPGPSIAALVSRVVARGHRGVLPFLAAMWFGEIVWLSLAVWGVASVAAAFQPVFVLVKWLGVGYLLFLAWKMWSAPAVGGGESLPERGAPLQMFGAGLAVTFGNPKIMVFYVALLPTLVEMQGMTLGRWGSLAVVAVAVLVLIDLAWVLLAAQARRFVQSAKAVRTANRCSAGVMVGAAAAVATRS